MQGKELKELHVPEIKVKKVIEASLGEGLYGIVELSNENKKELLDYGSVALCQLRRKNDKDSLNALKECYDQFREVVGKDAFCLFLPLGAVKI
jgi:hypothetical protein